MKGKIAVFTAGYAAAITACFFLGFWMKSPENNFFPMALCLMQLATARFSGTKAQKISLGANASAAVLMFFPAAVIDAWVMLSSLAVYAIAYFFSHVFSIYKSKLDEQEAVIKEKATGLRGKNDGEMEAMEKEDDEMEREQKDIRSLYDANKEFSTTLNTTQCMEKLNEILKKILKNNFGISPDDIFYIIAYKKDSEFVIAQSHGYDEESLREKEKAYISKIMKAVPKTQEVLYIPDTAKSGQDETAVFNKSMMYVPFYAEKKIIGVLMISSNKPNIFNLKQVESMKFLTNQIALSLEKARLYEEVEKLSETDSLTGLFVHRLFQEKLENEIKRTERYGGSLALVLGDIDHFKLINDTYGHLAGDYILKTIAIILKNHTTSVDTVARYGGEEFVIIFPENDKEKGHAKAVKIRKEIEKYPFKYKDVQIKITMSMGVSSYPLDAQDRRSLIEKADKALYKAKEEGRNRVIRAE